jgi:hypothetical protein
MAMLMHLGFMLGNAAGVGIGASLPILVDTLYKLRREELNGMLLS